MTDTPPPSAPSTDPLTSPYHNTWEVVKRTGQQWHVDAASLAQFAIELTTAIGRDLYQRPLNAWVPLQAWDDLDVDRVKHTVSKFCVCNDKGRMKEDRLLADVRAALHMDIPEWVPAVTDAP